jgi:hypothetical protein
MSEREHAIFMQLYQALVQLLNETREAGFETATDYNWPKSITDAKAAILAANALDLP